MVAQWLRSGCAGFIMEQRQMTTDDFLAVMAANKEFYPDYDKLSQAEKVYLANINIITGTAHSYFTDKGEFFGVGGIRYIGLGEAWCATFPHIRLRQKKKLFEETKDVFIKTRDEKNLWRVFAESKISDKFLEHLGFKKEPDMHIWTRTE